ncbi:aquaporin-like protein [Halenospora varia]|nr:aquaporin-like protein [Halenospora varia]
MADQQHEGGGHGDTGHGQTGEQHIPTLNTIIEASSRENSRPTSPIHTPPAIADPQILPLHRSGTMPIRPRRADEPQPFTTRPRGRTESSNRNSLLEPRPLSPRMAIFKKQASNNGSQRGSPAPATMSDGGENNPRRPRASTVSSRRFSSSGMRPRIGTWGPSPNRASGSTINRRSTVLMASGRDPDIQSNVDFSLAGPSPIETVPQNQPYVDPGYAELNPAYDQPSNSRPVWGLAKPLPRVIRPGMVPTRSELRIDIPAAEAAKLDQENLDLEQGRIEPTLRVNRVSSQLENARQARENRLLRTLSRSSRSPMSPAGRLSNLGRTFTPASQAIEEESDVGLQKPGEFPAYEEADGDTRPDWYPDDASSAATEHEQEGDLDGDWIGEEFPLKAYEATDDEIHNLHTHWSVIRLRFREPLAELLAVTVQLTLGFCADLVVVTSASKAGNEETTDWAWGLATMVGIYIAGGISGAHLNPAISIMLWIYRGFPLRKVPSYVFAQILGAFIAALLAFGLYRTNIMEYASTLSTTTPTVAGSDTLAAFVTYPRYAWINPPTAFFTEFVGTAFLAVTVLALGDDTNAPPGAGMSAFILGLVITVLSMAFGYNTGAAMNPARDLGPRLACWAVGYGGNVDLWGNHAYWIWGPWCGTISGAIVGAFLYDAAIFVGGESPVNYPRRRIKRANKKWRRKWAGRVKRVVAKVPVGREKM